jgi:hypothetical protein
MKPNPGDYAPYYDQYISILPDEDILKILENQMNSSEEFLRTFSEEQGNYSYAEGKWTMKEVIGHIIDTERVMAYRALSFSRGEKQSLPGFEQDDYIANGNCNDRTLDDLIGELKAVRTANLIMFRSFSDEMLKRGGIASDNKITVLALIYIIAGHEKHHIRILREKYLQK